MPVLIISPEIIATIITTVMADIKNQNLIPAIFIPTLPVSRKLDSRSKKLSNIPKNNGDIDNLDIWKQLLIQHKHINHDQCPTNMYKIIYIE